MRALIARGSRRTSMPNTSSRPAVTGDEQWIIFTVEVFPAPFGPRKPKHSPAWMANETPSTAVSLPYLFVRPPASMTGGMVRSRFAPRVRDGNAGRQDAFSSAGQVIDRIEGGGPAD